MSRRHTFMAFAGQEQLAPPGRRKAGPLLRLRQIWAEETGAVSLSNFLASILLCLIPTGAGGRLRSALYRRLGLKAGIRNIILGSLELGTSPGSLQRITLGHGCFINSRVFIDAASEVTLGDGVAIGHHVVIITTDHVIGPSRRRAGAVKLAPVTIGDGAWIAAGVVILPGVTIGAGAVIAAGAVVRKDIPPNVLAGGVPARVIRHLDQDERPFCS
jgi:acetyltransferase-like isoleucine patch superfamily enzyme